MCIDPIEPDHTRSPDREPHPKSADVAESELRHRGAAVYEIEVLGVLDAEWSDWLGGMDISRVRLSDGTRMTMLRGVIQDQAQLRGILMRIMDLNLALVSTRRIDSAIGREDCTSPPNECP